MKDYISVLLIMIGWASGQAGLNAQTSLDTLIERALHRAPSIQYFKEKVAQENARSAVEGALPNPVLQFQYLPAPVETREGPQHLRISVMQSLGWPGLYQTRRQVGRLSAQAFEAQQRQNERDIRAYIANLYYEGAYWSSYRYIIDEQLQLLNMLDTIVQERYRQGQASMVDIERIDISRTALQWEHSQARHQLKRIQAILQRWTDLPFIEWPRLERLVPPSPPTSSLYLRISDSSWALASDSIRWQQARLIERLRTLQTRPYLSVGSGYILIGEGKDALIAPSVGIQSPIFSTKNRALRKTGTTEAAIWRYKMKDTHRQLSDLLSQLTAQYAVATDAFQMHQRQSQLSHHSLILLTEDYATGRKGFWEVINMFNQTFDHRKMALRSQWQQFHIALEIERIIGKY